VTLCAVLFLCWQDSGETPVGAWRGESKCMVRPSGCNDEDSLYRVSAVKEATDRVRLSANKIVNGKEVNMGDGECSYDAHTRAMDCPLPNGNSIHLEWKGNALDGQMTLKDGTPWRRISLHRVGSS